MALWGGRSDLLGRVVGGYRLDSPLGGDGVSAAFLGSWAGVDPPGGGLPQQAVVRVFPVPASAPPETQTEVRARFLREVEALQGASSTGAPPLLASGEDAVAGLLYLVTPTSPPPPTSFVAPPPPDYGWPAPPVGAPYMPYGRYTPYAPAAQRARRFVGLRVAGSIILVLVGCCACAGTMLSGLGTLITLLPHYPNGGTYQASSGCSDSGSASAGGASVSATPQPGALPDSKQALRLQATGDTDISTLDPPDAYDSTAQQYASLVFPGLVALDKNLCVIPWAARSLPTVSADGTTYTFAIRPGLKWSDGVPITSETFAYAMNRAENPCNSFGAAYYLYDIQDAADFNGESCDTLHNTISGSIQTLIGDSILTPDPLTLQIQLAYPATYFLRAMAYPAFDAVPEQLIKQYGNKYIDHLADGPGFGGNLFKVTRWDHTGGLRLTRNETFWGQKPTLREVDVRFYKDDAAAYHDYLAGRADVGSAPAAQVAQVRRRATFHQIAIHQIDYYAMNWKKAPFDDVRMRQAFAIALDKQALAGAYEHGTRLATNHIVPSGTPGYNPNLLGPDGTQSLRGDTALANRLATAYATQQGCGTATDFSRCPPVMLTIASGSQDTMNQAVAAKRMWLKAMPKYPISIVTMDFDTLLQVLSSNNVQFWGMSWVEDYPDPEDWLTTNLTCDSYYNNGSACDDKADSLMYAADGNPDQQARLAQYQQAEQLMVTEVGWLPLDQATMWWETRPPVRGYGVATTGLITYDTWQSIYLARG